MKYDIHNPTPATRVIYDGIPKDGKEDGAQRMYSVPPGETREGIELSNGIAEELQERTRGKNKPNADLQLTPSASDTPAQKQSDSAGKVLDQTTRQTKK